LSTLQRSAKLGARLAALLDVEKPVLGVTTGKPRRELVFLSRVTGAKTGLSLAVTCGWGHEQKERDIVMPGRGRIEKRDFTEDELAAIAEGAYELGLSVDQILSLWGKKTLDVYLNNETLWSNVPEAAWHYRIGGYPILRKWLSYRERDILGRNLTKEEAREFKHIVRRVSALLLLKPPLDQNYREVKAPTYPWY
jgi:hypothetical protein